MFYVREFKWMYVCTSYIYIYIYIYISFYGMWILLWSHCGLGFTCLMVYQFFMGYSYLPNPPLGQDMTQGQFFKQSLTGLNSVFLLD